MNDAECSLKLVHCERVTEWPPMWQIATIVGLLVVAAFIVWRSR